MDQYVYDKVKECIIYNGIPAITNNSKTYNTAYFVEDSDVISSMLNHFDADLHCAVLNHMCYKEPAPYFLKGERGREEDLCRYSKLFDILAENKEFYKYNQKHKNKGLCENRAMYIPGLEFTKDQRSTLYSVIGAQAPDWKHCGLQYHMFSKEENLAALKERIQLILRIALEKGVDILILGDFGCNVYGQDPRMVASIFNELLTSSYKGYFKEIIFPIERIETREIFKNVFK